MTNVYPPRTILVPTDLSPTSEAAFLFARSLHERYRSGVRVLNAAHFDMPPYFTGEQISELSRQLKDAARGAAEYVTNWSSSHLGFTPEVVVVQKQPVEAILAASDESGTDLIVLGTHGRHGVDRLWVGSVAERVLQQSKVPVLAVRSGMRTTRIQHVLCPANLTEISRGALEYAAAIAQAEGGRLTVIHAVEPGSAPPDCGIVPDTVRALCDVEEVTYHGDAPGAILTAASELKPDVIVMGGEKKASPFGAFFSSTTERVMQWAQSPLIVVPRMS